MCINVCVCKYECVLYMCAYDCVYTCVCVWIDVCVTGAEAAGPLRPNLGSDTSTISALHIGSRWSVGYKRNK